MLAFVAGASAVDGVDDLILIERMPNVHAAGFAVCCTHRHPQRVARRRCRDCSVERVDRARAVVAMLCQRQERRCGLIVGGVACIVGALAASCFVWHSRRRTAGRHVACRTRTGRAHCVVPPQRLLHPCRERRCLPATSGLF